MRIQIYPEINEINPSERLSVKEFLIAAFKLQPCRWPSDIHCSIFMDGKTRRIVAGSGSYSLYNKDIHVGSYEAIETIPEWVPGTLMTIAFYFRLDKDPEVIAPAMELLARTMADMLRPFQTLLMQNFNGVKITEAAINAQTKQLAAVQPPLEPNGPVRLVLGNGEEHELGQYWFSFPMPERR